MDTTVTTTRRSFVKGAVAGAMAMSLPAVTYAKNAPRPAMRPIPSTGEMIPAVGLGTWVTFNVGDDPILRNECAEVMAAFFNAGGRIIDSSPM